MFENEGMGGVGGGVVLFLFHGESLSSMLPPLWLCYVMLALMENGCIGKFLWPPAQKLLQLSNNLQQRVNVTVMKTNAVRTSWKRRQQVSIFP